MHGLSDFRLRDFWYDTQKKSKRHARDNGLEGWNEVAVWQEFKPPFISGEIWTAYIEHVTSERFSRRSQSGADNRNRQIYGSVTTHTSGSVPFSAHAKRMAASLGREPSPMELFLETHVRSQDRQKGVQQFVDNRAQHFETYNSRLRERYGDNPSTHPDFDPDLWMEAGSSGGPDKNRVYGLSNTTADNLRSTRSVSTVGSSPSVSNTQSEEFIALKQQYQQLSTNYDELCQIVMEMRSKMGDDTCAASFWPYGPGNNQPPPPPPPPPPAPPLF
ncbi:hypothetical protein Peur_015283 [Populus x canadensis]